MTETELCGASQPGYPGFYCSREAWHEGVHIAAIGPFRPGTPVLAAWSAEVEPTEETITADDKARLVAIIDALTDSERLAALVWDYYHDNHRARRTSRSQMYLHLGMLTGAVLRALREKRP